MNTKYNFTTLVFALALAGFSTASAAANFPATPQEFSGKTVTEMKAFADAKVALNKPLAEANFKGKTETELSLMRNSIYAQAGFAFSEPWLKNYFQSRAWYKEGNYSPKSLTKVDFANIKMIYDYQKSNNLLGSFVAMQKPAGNFAFPARKMASHPNEVKMNDQKIRAELLKLRYCNYKVDDEILFRMTFHRSGVVTLKTPQAKGGATAYEDAYVAPSNPVEEPPAEKNAGAAYEGGEAYDGAYNEGSSKSSATSSWRIKNGQVLVTLQGGPETALVFTNDGLKKHICY